MAIYYMDPHTTVNGTGTWASPWSPGTSTRTGLTAGDEIRIKGVDLTSLLTPTLYTASFTSSISITLTSGGGLGADFVAGSVLYFPQYDTFAKIISSSANVLSIYSNGMLPIYNSAATAGSIDVRKVDTSTYGVSTIAATYYMFSGAINNITISDCWINETTRVSDGTVKTLLNASGTGVAACYFDSSSTGTYGHTIDLSNTCILNSNALTTSNYINSYVYGSNSTVTVGQIFSQYLSGGTSFGASTAPIVNTNFSITHAGSLVLNTSYGKNLTYTATNVATYCTDMMFSTSALVYANNFTLNFNYIISAVASYNVSSLGYLLNVCNATINYNGMIDVYGSGNYTYLMAGYGNLVVNLHPTNFSVKYNKKISTQTSFSVGIYLISGMTSGNVYYVPTLNSTGIIYTTAKYYMAIAPVPHTSASKSSRIPNVVTVDFPTSVSATIPYGVTYNNNTVVTYDNGTDPIEILGINGSGYSASAASTGFPVVQKDASMYRTSAPSLKSFLASRTVGYWTSAAGTVKTSMAAKSIKVPVTANVQVTITGYIRTDDATYVTGDCDVSLFFLGTEVATQAMTTSCVNAWEQFTLTFTPTQTGEAILLWEMYYANGGKSYWLDDLVIT